MIPLERDRARFPNRAPLALEARQMVYGALSAGPGGLAYRIMPQDWQSERRDLMLDEIVKVNKEIRQVRDLLAMGYPRQLAETDDPDVQVTCIDAAPLGLLVLAINHDVQHSPPEMPPSAAANPKKDVAIALQLPRGFEAGRVQVIEGDEQHDLEGIKRDEGQIRFTLESLSGTAMLLVKPAGTAGQ